MLAFRRLFGFVLLVWGCLAAEAGTEVGVPPLRGRITDLAGILSAQQSAQLEQRLAHFEQQKGSQIAVLLVPTTQPETIEQYGIRVVEQWRLGRKGVDDGVLVLLAKDDRTVRIEVGRGLEGAIPDAIAKRIVEEIMIPHFRNEDYYGGISAGVERVIGLVEGEPLPEAAWRGHQDRHVDAQGALFSFIAAIVLGHFLKIFLGRMMAGVVAAGLLGFVVTGVFGLPFGSAIILGLIVFVFIIGNSARGGSGYYYGRYGGGYRAGSNRGGGFDGDTGGFSGGGGDFSGGGASGHW